MIKSFLERYDFCFKAAGFKKVSLWEEIQGLTEKVYDWWFNRI